VERCSSPEAGAIIVTRVRAYTPVSMMNPLAGPPVPNQQTDPVAAPYPPPLSFSTSMSVKSMIGLPSKADRPVLTRPTTVTYSSG